ncbi:MULTISPECIES: hypothetical protein [Paenibacillus]|uniref:Uncharacterized protein n=1 Tax=Paenibacillus albilobatus TaxID=2716884 RepID=A0A920CF64_9BACL|nr:MULTISPECIES: hypothetical protein [Paenibacillus]GIO34659.1 hypothetical protein J2TS6_58000 [Paenibacillus albilobatus]
MTDRKCFVITPIGPDDLSIRRQADGVIDAVIEPILNEMGFEKMVVANLTGLNPNVLYELAIRNSVRKPVVQICEKGHNVTVRYQ